MTSPFFHPTTLHSHLSPNHTLPPHTHLLPPVTQELKPDLTPKYHTSMPGRQSHARTFQDNAESKSFNLNSGGECWRCTRTDLEDRQARARATRGGGQTSPVRVNEGGRRLWQVHFFLILPTLLLSKSSIHTSLTAAWALLAFETPAPLIAPVLTITPLPLLYHVRTFYTACYTSPTTHRPQPTYTFDELPK